MRIITFNIKHGAGEDSYRGNPELTAESCAGLNADILALQEVDQRVPRSKFANMGRMIAEASGMELIFAKTMRFRGGKYGNALLAKGEFEETEILKLGGGKRFKYFPDRRNAILTTAKLDEGNISIAATHLSTDRSVSSIQLPKVLDSLSTRPGPHLLLGDLNRHRGQVILHTGKKLFDLVDGPPTYPASIPKRSIDHIAVRGLSIQAITTEQLPISDHRALVVEATITKY